tara:strand:- start:112 stop:315 length:204 start_codon:yes stop_codon:yes gene_type:complete
MKTLRSLTHEADIKREMWEDISRDDVALKDRNKTKKEAQMLANYFEGMYDGLCDVAALQRVNKSEAN